MNIVEIDLDSLPASERSKLIHTLVRQRDGFKCTRCEMTNADHIVKHKSQLHVHRLIPGCKGGEYTLENCVSLCKRCHDREPKGIAHSHSAIGLRPIYNRKEEGKEVMTNGPADQKGLN